MSKSIDDKNSTNPSLRIMHVIARLLLCAGIIIWFIICAFGWVVPIALQNDGYNTALQLISFSVWLFAISTGFYMLAKNIKIVF